MVDGPQIGLRLTRAFFAIRFVLVSTIGSFCLGIIRVGRQAVMAGHLLMPMNQSRTISLIQLHSFAYVNDPQILPFFALLKHQAAMHQDTQLQRLISFFGSYYLQILTFDFFYQNCRYIIRRNALKSNIPIQSPFYDENSLGIILQKVIENIIISIFIFLFTNMQGHSGLQEQVNICLQGLDQELEKSYIKIDDAIASFEDLLHLQPLQIMHSQIHEQPLKTNPFTVQLHLQDIIIHEVNQIQQHKKLETQEQQVKEEEQEIIQAYVRKQDMFEILTQITNISDESYLNEILEKLRQDKITDSLEYLCSQSNKQQSQLKYILDLIKNISELDFYKQNYSKEEYWLKEGDLQFLKFLVHLTAIDERFIQCGSNCFNLLVEMKVDLREQSFEGVRIKDTSLVGGNFVRCNFNGSEFDNVDISGMNLNQAQLFNCKWKNIKIHELNKLDGHSSCVNSVNFSPDGTTLASGSYDNSIRLWDVKTGQQKAKLDGHSSSVNSVNFSPDGTTLASGSADYSIRLWDVKTGQQKAKLDGHSYGILSVNFSPDGTTLASCSYDMSIRQWDVKTGQYKAKLDGHSKEVYSVNFSPDGNRLASDSWDESIRLWNVITSNEILQSNNSYKVLLTQFKIPLQNSSLLPNINSDRTIHRICQNPQLEASGTLILKGQFINHQGIDLKPLLKSKGSCFIEVLKQK
ncbi:unnamed protein product (macronuclear) [Paramecium tetraurelia]|uniref:Uncharacterized protein n=1 Tax=Paramecium tetraurelia TaxID=5888 RepID=A0DHV1_PARTE|nr:uncharacterized protein GSPATT00039493001 [Paramecium tetraurelia]CAK82618.1 unnamed protein product [Paramecium tetraurelia]|eukprot:XP_001450015.1 hypothetical protein (macronuclear) [Paramecium tetraurelia strain d4-2]